MQWIIKAQWPFSGLILTLQVNERIDVPSTKIKLCNDPSAVNSNLVSKLKKLS